MTSQPSLYPPLVLPSDSPSSASSASVCVCPPGGRNHTLAHARLLSHPSCDPMFAPPAHPSGLCHHLVRTDAEGVIVRPSPLWTTTNGQTKTLEDNSPLHVKPKWTPQSPMVVYHVAARDAQLRGVCPAPPPKVTCCVAQRGTQLRGVRTILSPMVMCRVALKDARLGGVRPTK